MAEKSHTDLAAILGDLAVKMQGQADTQSTLQTIVDGAIAIVPGTRGAGISLIDGDRVTAKVPSDPVIAKLESMQTDLGDGPCLTALRKHRTVMISDMRTETRWPEFAAAAADLGVAAMLSFQLFVQSNNLGALNLYSDQPGSFDEESVVLGQLVAQHASVALIGAAAQAQFHDGLASRDVIGQAKGILMHRENLTGLGAFQLMVKTSQNANIKLVELALWLVEQHENGVNGS